MSTMRTTVSSNLHVSINEQRKEKKTHHEIKRHANAIKLEIKENSNNNKRAMKQRKMKQNQSETKRETNKKETAVPESCVVCVCACVRACIVAQYFVLHETVIVFSLYTNE